MKTRTTRDCPACTARYSCVWVPEGDAWVCRRANCQSEWTADHGPEFEDPSLEGAMP